MLRRRPLQSLMPLLAWFLLATPTYQLQAEGLDEVERLVDANVSVSFQEDEYGGGVFVTIGLIAFGRSFLLDLREEEDASAGSINASSNGYLRRLTALMGEVRLQELEEVGEAVVVWDRGEQRNKLVYSKATAS